MSGQTPTEYYSGLLSAYDGDNSKVVNHILYDIRDHHEDGGYPQYCLFLHDALGVGLKAQWSIES